MLLRPALDDHPRLVLPGEGPAVLPLEAGCVRAARGLILGGDEGLGKKEQFEEAHFSFQKDRKLTWTPFLGLVGFHSSFVLRRNKGEEEKI